MDTCLRYRLLKLKIYLFYGIWMLLYQNVTTFKIQKLGSEPHVMHLIVVKKGNKTKNDSGKKNRLPVSSYLW